VTSCGRHGRRAMRRAVLLTMVTALLSTLWRLDYVRVVSALLRASAPSASPIAIPTTEHAPTATSTRKLTAAGKGFM
jgi:hypothetical protein